ncbi:hypothetical protein PVAP13_3NG100071 [Panicum virgatum]|uniref:Amino acid transporter transmembrane domain-containing protein n=1 Tax=Panicum virgatum TaxID=38727 RepID=A0A8T0U714_PANVG|nr:hypothetical protein PVAP13_3NG100071 [Panicum virgatum]
MLKSVPAPAPNPQRVENDTRTRYPRIPVYPRQPGGGAAPAACARRVRRRSAAPRRAPAPRAATRARRGAVTPTRRAARHGLSTAARATGCGACGGRRHESKSSVYWAFGDELLDHSNDFSLLLRSGFGDAAVVLMLVHQFITFGFACTPLYFIWEKLVGMHEAPRRAPHLVPRHHLPLLRAHQLHRGLPAHELHRPDPARARGQGRSGARQLLRQRRARAAWKLGGWLDLFFNGLLGAVMG